MSLKKNIAGTLGINILLLFFGFANSILSTRILGAQGKGQFAIFLTSISLFSLLLTFGLQSAITYYVSRKEWAVSKICSTFLLFSLLITGVFFLVIRGVYVFGSRGLFLPVEYDNLAFQLVLTFNYFFQIVFLFMSSIMSGRTEFGALNRVSFFIGCLTLMSYVGLFIVYKQDSGAVQVADIFLLNLGITALSVLLIFVYYFRLVEKGFSFSLLPIKSILPFFFFGGITFIANVAQFLNYRFDFWMVKHYSGEAELGIYSVASTLAQMIWILPNVIATVIFPYFSKRENHNNIEVTKSISRVVFFVCFVLAFSGAFLSIFFIPILYGPVFAAAANILLILFIGIVPACSLAIIASYFSGNNQVKINMMASLLGLVVTVILDFILIPKHGITGAAIASAISYLTTTTFGVIVFSKATRSHLKDIFLIKKMDLVQIYSYSKSLLIKE